MAAPREDKDESLRKEKMKETPTVKSNAASDRVVGPSRGPRNAMQVQISACLASASVPAPTVSTDAEQKRIGAPVRGPRNAMQAQISAALESASQPSTRSLDSSGEKKKLEPRPADQAPSVQARVAEPKGPMPKKASEAAQTQEQEDASMTENNKEMDKVRRYLEKMRGTGSKDKDKSSKKEKKDKKAKAKQMVAGPAESKEQKKEKKAKKKNDKKQEKARKKEHEKERALIAAERETKRIFGRSALVIGSSSDSSGEVSAAPSI